VLNAKEEEKVTEKYLALEKLREEKEFVGNTYIYNVTPRKI
jgi:hypothetical protein